MPLDVKFKHREIEFLITEYGRPARTTTGLSINHSRLANEVIPAPSGCQHLALSQQGRLDAIQPLIKLLREIGDRHSKTPSQVAIRWLIENPIVLPIPGAKNGEQAAENAGALLFSLTPEEVEALGQASLAWRR